MTRFFSRNTQRSPEGNKPCHSIMPSGNKKTKAMPTTNKKPKAGDCDQQGHSACARRRCSTSKSLDSVTFVQGKNEKRISVMDEYEISNTLNIPKNSRFFNASLLTLPARSHLTTMLSTNTNPTQMESTPFARCKSMGWEPGMTMDRELFNSAGGHDGDDWVETGHDDEGRDEAIADMISRAPSTMKELPPLTLEYNTPITE
mmetsp:Transcript_3094/g.5972  ORF Transcript_3094/g.5972 Transcript_3094/m.5972 type:complete len:202 (+) Transcript_3094:1191-1796(+)